MESPLTIPALDAASSKVIVPSPLPTSPNSNLISLEPSNFCDVFPMVIVLSVFNLVAVAALPINSASTLGAGGWVKHKDNNSIKKRRSFICLI